MLNPLSKFKSNKSDKVLKLLECVKKKSLDSKIKYMYNDLKLIKKKNMFKNPKQQESATRRWSSVQSRDFAALHETMATMVLHCDVSPYRTEREFLIG